MKRYIKKKIEKGFKKGEGSKFENKIRYYIDDWMTPGFYEKMEAQRYAKQILKDNGVEDNEYINIENLNIDINLKKYVLLQYWIAWITKELKKIIDEFSNELSRQLLLSGKKFENNSVLNFLYKYPKFKVFKKQLTEALTLFFESDNQDDMEMLINLLQYFTDKDSYLKMIKDSYHKNFGEYLYLLTNKKENTKSNDDFDLW